MIVIIGMLDYTLLCEDLQHLLEKIVFKTSYKTMHWLHCEVKWKKNKVYLRHGVLFVTAHQEASTVRAEGAMAGSF